MARDVATRELLRVPRGRFCWHGTVSVAAKGAISVLKAIPGINLAAEILNATVAASFIAALGEGCVYVFEQICTGKMDDTDLDYIRRYFEGILQSQEFLNRVAEALKSMKGGMCHGDGGFDTLRRISTKRARVTLVVTSPVLAALRRQSSSTSFPKQARFHCFGKDTNHS